MLSTPPPAHHLELDGGEGQLFYFCFSFFSLLENGGGRLSQGRQWVSKMVKLGGRRAEVGLGTPNQARAGSVRFIR